MKTKQDNIPVEDDALLEEQAEDFPAEKKLAKHEYRFPKYGCVIRAESLAQANEMLKKRIKKRSSSRS